MVEVTLEDGNLKIGLDELLEGLSPTQKKWLSRQAVFQESLIEFVVGSIVDGTVFHDENGTEVINEEDRVIYQEDGWWIDDYTIMRAAKQIEEKMPEVMRRFLKYLRDELGKENDAHVKYRESLHKLNRHYRAAFSENGPDYERAHGSYDLSPWSPDQAQEFVERIIADVDGEELLAEMKAGFNVDEETGSE